MRTTWVSEVTGEVYRSFWHAITTIISDMIHYKMCRTTRMFRIRRQVEA